MIKRAILALAMLAAATVAHAAGTVPGFSLTPQFDTSGKVMPGCKLYIYQAGTVATPQSAYQDSDLSVALSNPVECDSSGRLPQFFLADGTIKLRLTTSAGSQVFVGDNLLVVGPSSGGGGGSSVDATTVLSTGDFKLVYGAGALSGFVRANGRTIGSATSGATERANADTRALFEHLWNNDSSLSVSGGRGANAAADWAANKTIALPNAQGRALAGLEGMGATAAGVLSSTYAGADPTVLGQRIGAQSHTLTTDEMPSHGHNVIDPGHSHISGKLANTAAPGGTSNEPQTWGGTGISFSGGTSTTGITLQNNGGGQAHSIVPPYLLITVYIKL